MICYFFIIDFFLQVMRYIKRMIPGHRKQQGVHGLPYRDIITFQKNSELVNTFDFEMNNIQELGRFSSVECHIVIYPYSRNISSKDMSVYPFQEYVDDILSHQRSAYEQISSPMSNLFGLFLGLLITLVFFVLKRDDLYSVESIVSVIGAYIIGKELWNDLENFMINLTKKMRVRYIENYYSFQLEKQTTLTHYSYLAKKERYGKSSLMPCKMDYIEQSNSHTIRMFFNSDDLNKQHGNSAHLLSLHIDHKKFKEFEKRGFMLGIKISLNKNHPGFRRSFEYFQSVNGKTTGCLDEKCKWVPGGIFYRKTILAGRIKYFKSTGLILNGNMIISKSV